MESLPGVYEGRIVSLGDGNVTAFVPQVFGDTTIVVSNFLSAPAVGRGWITFQSGDPEHPVWLSGVVSSDGGGGFSGGGSDGFSFIQSDAPTPKKEGQTWFDLSDG